MTPKTFKLRGSRHWAPPLWVGLMALLLSPALFASVSVPATRIFTAIMLAVMGWWVVRLWLSQRIVVRRDHLQVRGLYRWRTFPRDRSISATIATDVNPYTGKPVYQQLVIVTGDGREWRPVNFVSAGRMRTKPGSAAEAVSFIAYWSDPANLSPRDSSPLDPQTS